MAFNTNENIKRYLDFAGLQSFWTKAKEFIAANYDVKGAADGVKVELLGEAETLTTFKAVEGAIDGINTAIDGINTAISGEDGNGGLAGRIQDLEDAIGEGADGKSLSDRVTDVEGRMDTVEGILNGAGAGEGEDATQGLVKDVEDLAGRVTELDKKDGRMDTAEEAIADLEDRVTALDSVAEDSKGRVKVAEEAIAALRADLGVNDKTDTTAFARIEALEKDLEDVAGENGSLAALEGKVTTLIGNDANKSVRTIANEELAAQLLSGKADADFKTLQELAAWLEDHPEDAATMNTAIQANTSAIGEAGVEGKAGTGLTGRIEALEAATGEGADGILAEAKEYTDIEVMAVYNAIQAIPLTGENSIESLFPEA